MIGYNYVQAIIADVDEIVAEHIEEIEDITCQRDITVRTTQGETFHLVLQAGTKKALEFRKKPKLSWLTPKVYKGKSMHEEEAESQPGWQVYKGELDEEDESLS